MPEDKSRGGAERWGQVMEQWESRVRGRRNGFGVLKVRSQRSKVRLIGLGRLDVPGQETEVPRGCQNEKPEIRDWG